MASRKEVLADKERADLNVPFRAGRHYRGFHDTKDLIPEDWVRL